MSNVNITPNMNLPNPVPGEDPGPDYANNLQSSLNIVDQHNHSAGSGVQINPNGMNINSDLTFNSTNNAIGVRSVRFFAQAAPITASAPDLGCLYVSAADLYYNDENGNQVQITSGGSVAGSSGTITGLPTGTAGAAYVSANGTFVFQQATSTAANVDMATAIIRYPGSYPTPSGNYIALQAPSGLATGYSITLPGSAPGATGFLTMDTSGNVGTSIGTSGGITGSNIASATITGSNIVSNINLPGNASQANGSNLVVSNANATNNLSIIRGIISNSFSIVSGEGFTVTNPGGVTGQYLITFTTAFADTPAFCVTVADLAFAAFCVNAVPGTTACNVYVMDTSGSGSNRQINFIAIGQRA